MAMFYTAGEKINYTVSGSAVGYHDVVIIGDVIGVTTKAAAVGEIVACDTVGVFKMEKATGAITQGAKVYLDSDGKVTTTSSSNTPCGIAWAAALSADTTCLVKINA